MFAEKPGQKFKAPLNQARCRVIASQLATKQKTWQCLGEESFRWTQNHLTVCLVYFSTVLHREEVANFAFSSPSPLLNCHVEQTKNPQLFFSLPSAPLSVPPPHLFTHDSVPQVNPEQDSIMKRQSSLKSALLNLDMWRMTLISSSSSFPLQVQQRFDDVNTLVYSICFQSAWSGGFCNCRLWQSVRDYV